MNVFITGKEKVGIKREVIEICNEIIHLDSRIEPLDALHIATAIAEKCSNFLFIDYGISGNFKLKKFAKNYNLNLLDFGIKLNADLKRISDGMIWRE